MTNAERVLAYLEEAYPCEVTHSDLIKELGMESRVLTRAIEQATALDARLYERAAPKWYASRCGRGRAVRLGRDMRERAYGLLP